MLLNLLLIITSVLTVMRELKGLSSITRLQKARQHKADNDQQCTRVDPWYPHCQVFNDKKTTGKLCKTLGRIHGTHEYFFLLALLSDNRRNRRHVNVDNSPKQEMCLLN